MKISYNDNSKKFIKKLKKHHGALSEVSANTVNRAAKIVDKAYEKELKKFTLRNKFTLGAVKIFKARPTRSSGDFRPIKDINAIVGIRKMKGGKDHYLKKQEGGDTEKGHANTKGRVPIPLDSARTSNSHARPIKGALRLQKHGVQTLNLAGRKFGVENDGFSKRQRWAILHKYSGTSRWDLSKQFFFTGIKKGLGVFKKIGKKMTMVRTLDKKTVKIKATHKFQKSIDRLTPQKMAAIFNREAMKRLRGK